MKAFYLTRPLTLLSAAQSRTYKAASEVGAPFANELYIAAQLEYQLLCMALQKTYPQEPLDTLIRILTPSSVEKLPGMPPFLGARAYANPVEEATCNCLPGQLQELKKSQPGRRHYRLLLMNAFGTNLGDNLMGLTAFRHVLAVLREHLPSVSVEVLLGWHLDDRLNRLFRHIDGIETIHSQGPTLAELAGYQAAFDTSDLLYLPAYGRKPMVDWYLWWMGLDPAAIAPEEKRNAVAISDKDRQFVAEQLPVGDGPRILINPMASCGLRSMPEAATRRLVETMLLAWPESQIILIQPLDLENSRIHHLAASINTCDRLAALVAAVDGLIGVDTYTTHLADATSTPSGTIYTSLAPANLYPYYPYDNAFVLPEAETLPAWGKMKVPEQVWTEIAGSYESAWEKFDFLQVVTKLRHSISRKQQRPGVSEPRLLELRPPVTACPTKVIHIDGHTLTLPLRQRDEPLARALDAAIFKMAAQVLRSGDTVAVLGAGCGETAVRLALKVGQHGRLVAIEPRRALHQLLCANLARADIWHAETHLVMPEGGSCMRRDINRLELAAESTAMVLSNSEQPEPVLCWPLDFLALDSCRLLVVSSPLARLAVLEGAKATLSRVDPVVIIGVVALSREREAFATFFKALNYNMQILELGARNVAGQGPDYGILVAEPA